VPTVLPGLNHLPICSPPQIRGAVNRVDLLLTIYSLPRGSRSCSTRNTCSSLWCGEDDAAGDGGGGRVGRWRGGGNNSTEEGLSAGVKAPGRLKPEAHAYARAIERGEEEDGWMDGWMDGWIRPPAGAPNKIRSTATLLECYLSHMSG
jgi:hypothetical protein